MGLFDKFKKKDDFDDLLKEPEGGSWELGGNKKGDDLALGNDSLGGQPSGDLALGATPGGQPPTDLSLGGDSLGGHNDVMGLPSESSSEIGSDSFVNPSDINTLNSNSTSASALNLDTSYPQQPQQVSQQQSQPQQQNAQSDNPVQDFVQSGHKSGHEFDLILTKLDLLKSTLQNFDTRLSHIEQKLYEENNPPRRRW